MRDHEVRAICLPHIHPYAFLLRQLAHDGEAHFASIATLLITTIGRHRAYRTPGVDPDIAGLESLCSTHGAADIAGNNGSGQAVSAVIGERKRLFLLLEGEHREDRAEDFLSCDLHGVLYAIEDVRRDVVALGELLRHVPLIDE